MLPPSRSTPSFPADPLSRQDTHLDFVWVHKLAAPHNEVHDLLMRPLLTDPVKLTACQPGILAQLLAAEREGQGGGQCSGAGGQGVKKESWLML
jgi:hypothetical protein